MRQWGVSEKVWAERRGMSEEKKSQWGEDRFCLG